MPKVIKKEMTYSSMDEIAKRLKMATDIERGLTRWVKAKCPECGCEYEYPEDCKFATCFKLECVTKYLHPELKKRRE